MQLLVLSIALAHAVLLASARVRQEVREDEGKVRKHYFCRDAAGLPGA